MFTAALFTIAKIWKQPKCLLADKWIKKIDYIYIYIYTHTHINIMEEYSALKKNKILPFGTTWMNLEDIMLSEISQTQKDKYCMV